MDANQNRAMDLIDRIDAADDGENVWPIQFPRERFGVTQTGPNSLVVTLAEQSQTNFEKWFLLTSDIHWDNPDCKREVLKRHLDEAVELNAGIIDNGDLFCAMQGKYDKRSSREKVRPEHRKGDYFDALVRTAADFWAPYAEHLVCLGYGNHESSVKDKHDVDLTKRLAREIGLRTGVCVPVGGYTNWIRFKMERQQERTSRDMWMIHGYAGGGQVTKDMIQSERQDAYVVADIMVSGHTHDSWNNRKPKVYLCPKTAVPKQRSRTYLKLGCYKDEYKAGNGGWHVETGKPPKPIGGTWLKFWHAGRRGFLHKVVDTD